MYVVVNKLPKNIQKVGNVYFTSKCYYKPTVIFGENCFLRYKRIFV